MPYTTYTPPFIFAATHTLGALTLTSLSATMIASPPLYHRHIIRATNPSTTDLFISTQFTAATQGVLHSYIRSTGILLLGGTIGVFATRNCHPASFTILSSMAAGVAAAHAYLLRDVITSAILRRAWLQETERVVKLGVVVGVNLLTAGVGLYASLSYGGWPWSAERNFFGMTSSTTTIQAGAGGGPGDVELDLEAVANAFVKSAVDLAGGIGGIIGSLL
ncbi:hypothetical protein Dda_5345 [Drechslerella dactyloides]|uniref:Uncharacterized protein n=1 Tax=Drechslerella dactyloides TaxID=74499 RepID=A0AAD6J0C3_DREDA|nr:hypothetical protein Dda_5345 [Drechslerella dactyloides]